MNINSLPSEILPNIFQNMDVKSIFRSSTVCKEWNSLIEEENMWHNILPSLPFKEEIISNEPIRQQVIRITIEEEGHVVVRSQAKLASELFAIFKGLDLEQKTAIDFFTTGTEVVNVNIRICKRKNLGLYDGSSRQILALLDGAEKHISIMGKFKPDFHQPLIASETEASRSLDGNPFSTNRLFVFVKRNCPNSPKYLLDIDSIFDCITNPDFVLPQ